MENDEQRRDLCGRIRDYCRQRGIKLAYPPATEEQLRLTEEQLGFPPPPLLRMFYAETANGGFLGLFGAVGGYAFDDSSYADEPRTIERLVSRSGWRPHLCIFEALFRHPGHMVQCEDIPDGFITVSDVGCGITLELDAETGRLYSAGCGEEIPAEDPTEPPSYLIALDYVAESLEEWLEPLLDGAPYPGKHPSSVGYLTPDLVSAICEADPQLVWRGVHLPQSDYEDLPDYEGY